MKTAPVDHLKEVPFGNFNLELNLCTDTYVHSEATGHARYYVAFVGNEFAGYMTIMASEMLHHRGVMQAVTDSFYVVPAFRSSGTFNKLLTDIENDLVYCGIRFLTIGLNPNMPHFDSMRGALCHKDYLDTEVSVTKELS